MASSSRPQQAQQQQKLSGPLMALRTTGLSASGRKAPKDKAVQDLSPTALRYRKFVKGLKSSFSGLSAKNRRKALGESACLKQLYHRQKAFQTTSWTLRAATFSQREVHEPGTFPHALP